MKETTFTGSTAVPPSNGGGGAKIPLLIGAVVALLGASVYNLYEINQLKTQLAETRELLATEVTKVSEEGTTSTKTTRASVAKLEADLAAARAHVSQLVGSARQEAAKEADQLEAKLNEAQAQQSAATARVAESVKEVSSEVSVVKTDTNTNRENVTKVSNEVAAVGKQASATQAELTKTIGDLKSTQGDLGIQSGLIATNAREISALRDLGDRTITEFKIAKNKTAQKVGDLQLRLTKTDAKKNRYTVEVIVDDKKIEKKDKTTNEPVQFLTARYRQPVEMVVNEVQKDVIVGYLSTPKVLASRKQ